MSKRRIFCRSTVWSDQRAVTGTHQAVEVGCGRPAAFIVERTGGERRKYRWAVCRVCRNRDPKWPEWMEAQGFTVREWEIA